MPAEHTRDAFGLAILKNSHPDIRRLKGTVNNAQFHGNKFWNSTLIMMDYLQEYPPEKEINILEVGCGWGIAGIFCAQKFNAQVIGLDADDSVFPFLELHADINKVEVNTVQMRIEEVTEDQLAAFDMIIGADICFWDSLMDEVAAFIERALDAGVPRVLLTDPGRPNFRALAESVCQHEQALYSDWAVPAPHNVWGLVLDIHNRAPTEDNQ